MGRTNHQPAPIEGLHTQAGAKTRPRSLTRLLLATALAAPVGIVSFAIATKDQQAGTSDRLDLDHLVSLCDEDLAKYDIAAVNLACAVGLPGSEGIDFQGFSETLDRWADHVRRETERHLYQFQQNPAEFENSDAYFRMLLLVTVMMQDFNVHYDKGRIREPDFKNSEDLFVHGILRGKGGTCVSMPVVYAAVGRRLGYPLKLVSSKGHLFVRWDDPNGERLNIEGTNETGMATHPDEYYHAWPHPLTPDEISGGFFLKSQSPKQELAGFLSSRGHCCEDNGNLRMAVQAYSWATQVCPRDPVLRMFLNDAQGTLSKRTTNTVGE